MLILKNMVGKMSLAGRLEADGYYNSDTQNRYRARNRYLYKH